MRATEPKPGALVEADVARLGTRYDVHAMSAGAGGVRGERGDEVTPDAAVAESGCQVDVQVRGIIGRERREVLEGGRILDPRRIADAADEIAGDAPVARDGEVGPLGLVLEIAAEPALAKGRALRIVREALGAARLEKDGVDLRDQPLLAGDFGPAADGNLARIVGRHSKSAYRAHAR